MTKIKKNQSIDLHYVIDKHLNARSLSKSISTLLKSKRKTIDFSPYYQRNYVWDTDKATFFIESILLGIEIPPLIMFISQSATKRYEIVDGRQRFETIKRFYEGDFKLTKKGLRSLSGLNGLNFQNLEPEVQSIFLNTTIRIIEFSTIGEHSRQDELEDIIKKEIFWRYNSGITPLKTIEVQRAQHLDDNFTALMEDEFSTNPSWLAKFQDVFFSRKSSKIPTDTECQAKIRELLVLEHFPINNYASTSGRRDTAEWLYDLYIEGAEDKISILTSFKDKIDLLHLLFIELNEKEWMIYQSVYWALVIMEENEIDIQSFFDDKIIHKLVENIKKHLDIFVGDERGFSKVTNLRFQNIADFFTQELKGIDCDFQPYLKNNVKEQKAKQPVKDATETMNQLATMRLNRPDAVTKTIEDLTDEMVNNAFLIRPAYQRQEVINIKKASGIIESMLLGIPLPTIFICRREDGICEVVDGQQRLLSILAFLGQSYLNDKNKEAWSKKNHFKLFKKLSILKGFGNSNYEGLPEESQDKIWEFELSVVYIDKKLNEKFDPIDLFIRLNNKPYPVKDHSFEMWNSYSQRDLIERIRSVEKECRSWFYYRKDSIRMENEELLSVFAYLSSKNSFDEVFEVVDVYNWSPRPLTFRLPKVLVTEWFASVNGDNDNDGDVYNEILTSIQDVELFIRKVKTLTESIKLVAPKGVEDSELLQQKFNNLLGVKGKVRLQKPFYMLWFLLLGVEEETINLQGPLIANEVRDFIINKQLIQKKGGFSTKTLFKQNIESFWSQFSS